MNIDDLNAKYDEIYKKNSEIQKVLTEVEDYNDILFFLYDTDIRRPNIILNSMIDSYETSIFKLREAHKEIKAALDDFGDEQDLARGVAENAELTDKIKELILWKLRRLFMIYDEEPVLPYVIGDFLNLELIGKLSDHASNPGNPGPEDSEDIEAEPDKEGAQLNPEGGVFSNPKNPA